MKRYIVAAAAGLVLLVVAVVMLLSGKFPVSVTVKLPPPPQVEAGASPAASSAPEPLSADEQGLGTPEAFLAAIYKHYEHEDPASRSFSSVDNPSLYYDPDMVALLNENNRLYDGEQGAIEIDPICQCQDYQSIKTTIRVVNRDDASAKAVATLKMSWADVPPYTVTYRLVRVDGRWRIHDIAGEYPSLRRVVQKSNEDARKHPIEANSSS